MSLTEAETNLYLVGVGMLCRGRQWGVKWGLKRKYMVTDHNPNFG